MQPAIGVSAFALNIALLLYYDHKKLQILLARLSLVRQDKRSGAGCTTGG